MTTNPSGPSWISDSERERIRLVEVDLSETNNFIKGVIGTSTAIRGSAFTVWLALIGFALQQALGELALLAVAVGVLFWILDGYHGWLYTDASKHARALESLLSRYYDALSRGDDDEDVVLDFKTQLRSHRYGLFLSFKQAFDVAEDVWGARPYVIYRGLYPALIVGAWLISMLVYSGLIGATK